MSSATDQKRLTAYFVGRVQGVGFRYTVERLSRSFDITGFVRNEHDGSVTVLAEGQHSVLNRFLQAIKTSQLGRNIKAVTLRWDEPSEEFEHFSVTYR